MTSYNSIEINIIPRTCTFNSEIVTGVNLTNATTIFLYKNVHRAGATCRSGGILLLLQSYLSVRTHRYISNSTNIDIFLLTQGLFSHVYPCESSGSLLLQPTCPPFLREWRFFSYLCLLNLRVRLSHLSFLD